MRGQLLVYGQRDNGTAPLVAFLSDHLSKEKVYVLIGGLTDGFMSLPYATELAKHAALLQPLFTSSYLGFGLTDIDNDCRELLMLLKHQCLKSFEQVVLVGHSTGSQVLLQLYSQYGAELDSIEHVKSGALRLVLQAPVSDRESFLSEAICGSKAAALEHQEMLGWAVSANETDSQLVCSKKFCNGLAAVTADRLISLLNKHGKEDYFSTDLTEEYLHMKLQSVAKSHCRIDLVLSLADQYVPDMTAYESFFKSVFVPAMKRANVAADVTLHTIPEADHACSQHVTGLLQILL